jgi:hypothetical protein
MQTATERETEKIWDRIPVMEPSMQLNERLLCSYGVGKVFKDHSKPVNSLDFTVDGMSHNHISSASE